ncbi:MAG: glycosyltransferase family 2 protein, partial [Thermoleophilia bacterium]|nr:glycosyltransferase family 2 protein [Thermoleophilia bacterium]
MISVVIPVYNGAAHLSEVLDAVTGRQLDEPFEVLVIDSGSTDGSLEIVRSFPRVRLLEIPNEQFGHGRTRNLGVRETTGDLIAFLTQDATPASPHWLAAYRRAFALDQAVGAAFGPHLPRPGVNPLMARLLIEHFESFSPDGEPAIQHAGDSGYLSNSNSCVARAAWTRSPFREIPYAEDQAFGADVLANGFSKVYMPDAAVWHSHDYGMLETFKRYFDEYRGLNDSVGEQTDASAAKALGVVSSSVAADLRFLEQLGQPPLRRAAWGVRSAIYHTGRVGFGGLGARANRMPATLRAALSFEGRSDGVATHVDAAGEYVFEDVGAVERDGAVPLAPALKNPGEPLHVAWIIPPFSVGGGGHTTIFRMVRALERSGHRCSLWVHDPHKLESK